MPACNHLPKCNDEHVVTLTCLCIQEDKEPLFDSVETILAMLEVSTEFAQNIYFNKERIMKSLPAGHLDATTMADYLVYKVRILFITEMDVCV